jgi:hypothetical protein
LTGSGYINFIPNSDWTTVQINSEATPYYYVRARVVTAFSTSPVGTEIVSIPQINWANVTATGSSNTIYALWTENAAAPNQIKEKSLSVTTSAPSQSTGITAVLGPSSTTLSSQPSTERHIVKTSDGTLHAFTQIGTQTATCGGLSKSGLLWFDSTDGGTTWTCQGQLSSDTTNLMSAGATVDSSDNIYVT